MPSEDCSQRQYRPIHWWFGYSADEYDSHLRRCAVALVQAVDEVLKTPGVKRLAQKLQMPWSDFEPSWLNPNRFTAPQSIALAWAVRDTQELRTHPKLQGFAVAILSAQQALEASANRRVLQERQQVWNEVLRSVSAEARLVDPEPLALIAEAELRFLNALVSNPAVLVRLETAIAGAGTTRIDLVNHARQSLAIMRREIAFPEDDDIDDDELEDYRGLPADTPLEDDSPAAQWCRVAISEWEWEDHVIGVFEAAAELIEDNENRGLHPDAVPFDGEVLQRAEILRRLLIERLQTQAEGKTEEDGGELSAAFDSREEHTTDTGEIPPEVLERIPGLVQRWRPSVNPRLSGVMRRLIKADGRGTSTVKRELIERGIRIAWAARNEPWKPRRDSRQASIIPAQDMSADEFRSWLDSRTMAAAAECAVDLLLGDADLRLDTDVESVVGYEPVYLPDRFGRSVYDEEDDSGSNSRIDLEVHQWEQEYGRDDIDDAEARRRQAQHLLELLRDHASPQQRAVLEAAMAMVGRGESVNWAEVARTLGRSSSAIKTQVRRLIEKTWRPGQAVLADAQRVDDDR